MDTFSVILKHPNAQCSNYAEYGNRSAAPCENVSSRIYGQWRPRSACASAQSDQGLHYPLTKSQDTIEYMNGDQSTGWYTAHVQDDVNPYILRMLEDTFAHDKAQIM